MIDFNSFKGYDPFISDSKSQDVKDITIIPDHDFTEYDLPFTSQTWDDGVPVLKYIDRCENKIPFTFCKGEKYRILLMNGCVHQEVKLLYFYYNNLWYCQEVDILESDSELLDQVMSTGGIEYENYY
jgi:hypothetical protein